MTPSWSNVDESSSLLDLLPDFVAFLVSSFDQT